MEKMVSVNVKTSAGDLVFELDAEKAPATVENFVEYVRSGHFDGTIFHRVIPGFVIQGGGHDKTMSQKKTRSPIRNEAANGLLNLRGTLSMARTSDPHSATSQFFINLRDNTSLDPSPGNPGYAVFGRVSEGLNVVDAIAKVKTGRSGHHSDVPVEAIIVESMSVRE
jgi:cyclophilin family peptidyl-prolyl cis-trans isomerase